MFRLAIRQIELKQFYEALGTGSPCGCSEKCVYMRHRCVLYTSRSHELYMRADLLFPQRNGKMKIKLCRRVHVFPGCLHDPLSRGGKATACHVKGLQGLEPARQNQIRKRPPVDLGLRLSHGQSAGEMLGVFERGRDHDFAALATVPPTGLVPSLNGQAPPSLAIAFHWLEEKGDRLEKGDRF